MEKRPQFLKEFSKAESPEARQETAETIKAKRSEYFAVARERDKRQTELVESANERQAEVEALLEELSQLKSEILRLSSSRATELLSYFKLKKVRADMAVGQRTYEELQRQQSTETSELAGLTADKDISGASKELQESRDILSQFYAEQSTKWAGSEYTKEDIVEQFSDEHLAALSLEDYALLLQRFPGEMVAHVTRQGIRDHTGHAFHTVGEGAYADGFVRMANDGRLRSPLGVYMVEEEKETAIANFLHLDTFASREEAIEYLEELVDGEQGSSGSYVDRAAIHFATEEVADSYYGSEKGNEIFIAYPSAYIASQYYFSGQLETSGGGYWNDQWVWANEERGLDLNAGVVFIPGEAKVDKAHGSRYELGENRCPVENARYKEALRQLIDSDRFHDFADEVMKISVQLCCDLDEPNPRGGDLQVLEQLEPYRMQLATEFEISDRALQNTVLSYHRLYSLQNMKLNHEKGEPLLFGQDIDTSIAEALAECGVLYAEATDTVSSKEYWEEFFDKDPSKRPSKIVYYTGTNPTAALRQWQKDNGIVKSTKAPGIGFPERSIARNEPGATAGIDRFRSIAEKVIDEYHFPEVAISA